MKTIAMFLGVGLVLFASAGAVQAAHASVNDIMTRNTFDAISPTLVTSRVPLTTLARHDGCYVPYGHVPYDYVPRRAYRVPYDYVPRRAYRGHGEGHYYRAPRHHRRHHGHDAGFGLYLSF